MLNIWRRLIVSLKRCNVRMLFSQSYGNGLLACAGLVNGIFGEGEMRHIAHWRSVKHVDVFTEEGEEEGETIIRRRERFSHELTLAYADGTVVEVKEGREVNQRHEERT